MKQMTLKDFISVNNSDLGENFSILMENIQDLSREINEKLSRNGLIEEQGKSGEKNVYGEEVEKLDEFANQLITERLLGSGAVHGVGSEELEEPKFTTDGSGEYVVTHDPLDGSSNIDINLPIGTIFGIYPKSDSVLAKGSSLVASGYVLYGPSLMLVYATRKGVNGFTFDKNNNQYMLSYENIIIPEKKIYSINEGNWSIFHDADRKYLEYIKGTGEYSLRYVGSMVGDVHRTIIKGGIFIYPSDIKHADGKLRLLYEVAPLGFLIKQAGGEATCEGKDPLEIMPEKHDQRVPIALGSKSLVNEYLEYLK